MSDYKKYVWATIEAKTQDELESECKKIYPHHIIVKRSIVKSQYDKELKYKQIFILIKLKSHPL